jgi:hypothetical protein
MTQSESDAAKAAARLNLEEKDSAESFLSQAPEFSTPTNQCVQDKSSCSQQPTN